GGSVATPSGALPAGPSPDHGITAPSAPGDTPPTPPGPTPYAPAGFVALAVGNNNFIPVNANNTNGSALTNGIPAKRDFNVNPIPGGDPELVQARVTYGPIDPAG